IANRREEAGIRGGIGPRRATYRRLVDIHDLVEEVAVLHRFEWSRRIGTAIKLCGHEPVKGVVDQGGLPRAGYACNTDEKTFGNFQRHVFQVVPFCANHPQLSLWIPWMALF